MLNPFHCLREGVFAPNRLETDQFVDLSIVQEPVGAEDDDAWLSNGRETLEAELAQRQAEMDFDSGKKAARQSQEEGLPSDDPSHLTSRFKVRFSRVAVFLGQLPVRFCWCAQ